MLEPQVLESRVAQVLERDTELQKQWVALATDVLLGLKVSQLVAVEPWTEVVLSTLTEENVKWLIFENVVPGFQRRQEQAQADGETLNQGLNDALHADLERAAAQADLSTPSWAEEAIDPTLIKQLLSPVLQKALLSFARRLPLIGSAAEDDRIMGIADRLRKTVEQRAGKLVDVGKSVMGGLGAEMDRKLEKAAKEFAEGANNELRDALKRRIESHEGRALVQQMRLQVLDRLLQSPLSSLMEDLARRLSQEQAALFAGIVVFNAGRDQLHKMVASEIEDFLSREGGQTVSQLLEQRGTLEPTTELIRAQVGEFSRELFATRGFAHFLSRVLQSVEQE